MRKDRYELCKKLIEEGQWQIDLENGIVIGRKGGIPHPTNRGYLAFDVRRSPKLYRFLVHEIIIIAQGLCPVDITIDHIDGNKLNNKPSNLQLLTRGENARKGNVGIRCGEQNPSSKLTEDSIREIRKMLQNGYTQKQIASMYNVDQSLISLIKNNKIWSEVI